MSLVKRPNVRIVAGVGALLISSISFALQAEPTAAPNPIRGKQLFLQCQACHTVTVGGPNSVGPNLSGVVGSKAATHPGYAYSPALTKSGIIWLPATLDPFLKRPSKAVPGTKMAFGGIADSKARADVIAYLRTIKSK